MSGFPLKHCSKCDQWLPATVEYFFPRKRGYQEFLSWCKTCRKAKTYEARAEHPEKAAQYKRTYRIKHRDAIRAYKHTYYRSHLEQERARGRRKYVRHARSRRAYRLTYYRENQDKELARNAAYQQANPDKVRAAKRHNRAKRSLAPGRHTAADIQNQYQRQKGKCYYCGKEVGSEYHVDHVTPLTRGGSDAPENLVIACPHCNTQKRAKLPHEWPEGGKLL